MDIKKLEIKKLFNELEYIESDYEYTNELINNVDMDFIKEVNLLLDKNPELKSIYDEKFDIDISEINNELSDEVIIEEIEEITENKIKHTPEIKKLYREIVKIAHPDKTGVDNFNNTYIKATEYYDMDDKIGIYKICSQLNINCDIETDDVLEIKKRINNLKNRIHFLESTFTYQWYVVDDINVKNKLVLKFIENKLK